MSIDVKHENESSDMGLDDSTVMIPAVPPNVELEGELYEVLEALQKELGFDKQAVRNIWESYQEISSNFTLEGKKLHWLACAVYVTCRHTKTTSVGRILGKTQPISLTALLRFCDLSLNQFFYCIKQWLKMTKLVSDLTEHIELAEKKFYVCQNVYKTYIGLFNKIFKAPDNEAIRQRKKLMHFSAVRIFEFTWLLFITMKGKYLECADDLVECRQLLLSCCNLAFKNAFLLNQRDVFNPDFEGLPADWHAAGYTPSAEAPCILDKLLGALSIADVKYVELYRLEQNLQALVEEETLKTTVEDFTDLFQPQHFEVNYSELNKIYEEFIIEEGSYDEKIFLGEYYRQAMLQSIRCSNGDTITSTPINERLPAVPETPLTGRQYVGPPDGEGSMDTEMKLRALLAGRPAGMTTTIMEIIAECGGGSEKIESTVDELTQRFVGGIAATGSTPEEEKKAFGVKLFYYLFEMILLSEKRLNKDIPALLEKQIFLECLFTCAMEITIHVLGMPAQFRFPWVLVCMQMPAAHFVKVIELVVRSNEKLTRNTIKHLCFVEETILERLMWTSDSVLWEDIKRSCYEIPKFEEIARPGTTITSPSNTRRALFAASAASAATESFQSPHYAHIKPGQSLLNPNRNLQAPPLSTASNGNGGTPPKKNGSFAIIFRKFYVLAGVRMDDLCKRLGINDTEFRMKIWTIFEYSVRETKLLENRHLDQLIMCAVYIICKVCSHRLEPMSDKNFTEIMNCYRLQPQAKSDIYRNVYIDRSKRDNLINFYNNIYVIHVKRFVSQFARPAGVEGLTLSPLPANRPLTSPRSQITRNVFVNSMDSPTSVEFTNGHSYYFNRSDSRDLKTINKAINGKTAKRLLTDPEDSERKRFANRKMQALIEEREVQKKI